MKGLQVGKVEATNGDCGKLDAFHVPAMLVSSSHTLRGGMKVIFLMHSGRVIECHAFGDWDGIIDPFIDVCTPGQMCWMFIRPDLVSGLRHVFDVEGMPVAEPEEEEDDDDDDGCRGCY